eukprot:COSAG01_NODE_21313_length_907_cov_4.700495_1_plen_38_part_10
MFGFGIMCYSNTVRKLRMMRACVHRNPPPPPPPLPPPP